MPSFYCPTAGKGRDSVEKMTSKKDIEIKNSVSAEQPRYIKSEVDRILNSKVFNYYVKNKSANFLESDLFDFLGTSARSLGTSNKTIFLSRYNMIVKDIIPFCESIKDKKEYAKLIIDLWNRLYAQFKSILDKKIK